MSTMRLIAIPGTDLELSVFGLGTALFGSATNANTAGAVMDAFLEAGGNWLDTAHVYAAWLPDGTGASERTIGAWLRDRGLRDSLRVSTKGCTLDLRTGEPPTFTSAQIQRELHESLERLQTDRIDLYWLHRDNPALPVEVILGAFQDHLGSGLIRHLGASNWTAPRLAAAAAAAARQGWRGFCASQIGWSLALTAETGRPDPTMLYMDPATYAYHVRSGLPVVAYSAQARGFFAGKGARLRDNPDCGSSDDLAMYAQPENLRRLARAEGLAQRRRASANQIALGYVTSHPFPSLALIGPRTVAQVQDSCGAAGLRLRPEEVEALQGTEPMRSAGQ